MSFFIVEALSGMGMHRVDIPESILLKQMKVVYSFLLLSHCGLIQGVGVLDYNPLLQRRATLCKSIHPDAVLPRLPVQTHASYLLDHDRFACYVWHMGCPECVPELRARGTVLGPYSSRNLSQFEGTVVLQRIYAHCH